MQASEAREWRQRASMVLTGSIPAFVASGGLVALHQFKDDLAVISRFVRLGTSGDKAKLAVLRIEGARRGAVGRGPACGEGSYSAARSATPPSNTGVNEGREWLLGSGL